MDHNTLKKVLENRKKEVEPRYKIFSKDRLLKNLKKKLQTCFIGDISVIEEILGYLWGAGLPEGKLTESQIKWKKVWNVIRKRMLDNGNDQIRAVENELAQYDVKWNRYQYNLEVKGNEE